MKILFNIIDIEVINNGYQIPTRSRNRALMLPLYKVSFYCAETECELTITTHKGEMSAALVDAFRNQQPIEIEIKIPQ